MKYISTVISLSLHHSYKIKIIMNNYKFATKLEFFIYSLKNSAASFFLFFISQASQSRKQ